MALPECRRREPSRRSRSENQIAVAVADEIRVLDDEGVAQISQQCLKAREVGFLRGGDALELDEAPEAIDVIEVNPHSLVEEKPSLFLDHSNDAECAGKRSFQF